MPFFDHYPYTNLHNVNLDWVLQKVKDWGAEVEYNNQRFENLKEANDAFKAYVTGYLHNLDVQDEINNKLDDMLASGELIPYLQPYISTEVSTWLTGHITPTTPPVDASLTVAGAAADAKATGDAINEVNTSLGVLKDLPYINLFDKSNVTVGYYINSSGAETAANGWYISNYIPVNAGDLVKFYGYIPKNNTVRIAFYNSERTVLNSMIYSSPTIANGYFEQMSQNIAFVRFSLQEADLKTFVCSVKKLASYPVKPTEVGNIKGVNPIKVLENTAESGYWDTTTQQVLAASGYRHLDLYPVSKGDVVRTDNAGTRPFVLYDSTGNVLDYRVLSSNDRLYHAVYEVIADGFIGFSFTAANIATYACYLNNSKIILNASLDWLDINIPEGVTWSTWIGKLAAMFGDSLVSGQRDDSAEGGAYCRRLKEHLSLVDCVNYGRSGRPIADGTANGAGTVTTVLAVTSYANIDLVIIAGGTNDFKLNVPIGTLLDNGSTFDRNTFYGALQTIAEYLIGKKSNIRVCLWTPLQRNNDGYTSFSTNTAGFTLSDYCNAIKEIGKRYSFPVIDMFNISGVNMLNLDWYTADGLHLNGQGYDVVSFIGAKQINTL